MATLDEVDEWEAMIRMWMRRVGSHPMLEPAVLRFLADVARLDREMKGPKDGRPTFEQDLDKWLKEREVAHDCAPRVEGW